MRKLLSFLFVVVIGIIFSLFANASKLTVDDFIDYQANMSWSEPMDWAITEGILNGYPDKTLKPYEYVTEAQMTVMLLNFLTKSEVSAIKNSSQAGEHWTTPYYNLAQKYHLDLSYSTIKQRDLPVRRGTVAKFFAQAITGKEMTELEAVQWMYDNEISSGHLDGQDVPPKTYKSYHPNDKLSRAHAVIFLYNIEKNLEDKSIKVIEQKTDDISVNGFELGDPQHKFEELYGAPKRISMNDDGLKFHTYYHNDYEDMIIVGFDQYDQAVFLYSNQEIFTARLNNINLTNRDAINSYFNINNSNESAEITFDNTSLTFYYDTVSYNTPVRAILIKQKDLDLTKTLEQQTINSYLIFDITNSYRQNFGLHSLKWNEKVANTAYQHSKDMFINDYFSHTNQKGQDPFSRIMENGIEYSFAGENIAYGFTNGIMAAEAWMNSVNHRETILNKNFTHLGVGSHSWYYTQNFITPFH